MSKTWDPIAPWEYEEVLREARQQVKEAARIIREGRFDYVRALRESRRRLDRYRPSRFPMCQLPHHGHR